MTIIEVLLHENHGGRQRDNIGGNYVLPYMVFYEAQQDAEQIK